jgi:hypothetical protein
MKKKVIYLDIDDTLSGHNKKIVKSSFWDTYKQRMKESWEAKVFGITLPVYAVLMIALLITVPFTTGEDDPVSLEFKLFSLIPHIILNIWFITSYILLIRRHSKDREKELKDAIWRDSQKSF